VDDTDAMSEMVIAAALPEKEVKEIVKVSPHPRSVFETVNVGGAAPLSLLIPHN